MAKLDYDASISLIENRLEFLNEYGAETATRVLWAEYSLRAVPALLGNHPMEAVSLLPPRQLFRVIEKEALTLLLSDECFDVLYTRLLLEEPREWIKANQQCLEKTLRVPFDTLARGQAIRGVLESKRMDYVRFARGERACS